MKFRSIELDFVGYELDYKLNQTFAWKMWDNLEGKI